MNTENFALSFVSPIPANMNAPPQPGRSRRRRLVFGLIALLLGLGLASILAEAAFRILEARELSRTSFEGAHWVDDPHWGWKPAPGDYLHRTPEYVAAGRVNAHFMNDREENLAGDVAKTRVLILGDSHTFATGISTTQTWAKQLEQQLNAAAGSDIFRTFNAGTTGYSLHQYLSRLRDDGPRLKPHYVVVGLSYATDFYDLLPPGRGGWIYGGDRERDYFDFDEQGKLVPKHWIPARQEAAKEYGHNLTFAMSVRRLCDQSATFRQLRRSKFMLMIGARVRVGGQSLWPNMEIVMEKEISPAHEYQHRLFKALLQGLKTEADRQGAKLIVTGIPYLPQVYDDLRKATFPSERYDPEATTRRVSRYCQDLGIGFVDAQTPMRELHQKTGRWLHFLKDAHPTAEGHQVIAEAVLRSKLLQSVPVQAKP